MRFTALFKKTSVENLRDWKILALTLLFAPFFVILMYFYFTTISQTFVLLVVNHDAGMTDGNGTFNAGSELIATMMNTSYPDGSDILNVQTETDITRARDSLIDKTADLRRRDTGRLLAFAGRLPRRCRAAAHYRPHDGRPVQPEVHNGRVLQ